MINLDGMTDDEKLAALESIHKSIAESKEVQKQKIASNVDLIVKALKKIEADIKQRYDQTGNLIDSIKNGVDGRDGRDGKDGKDGRNGKDGAMGPRGFDGLPGLSGEDGQDGVSVVDAQIDFDGSLTITLSNGRVINAGEILNLDLAEKIKVITNGGGTSQSVIDTLASLQAQITAMAGFVNYEGTWNASTNTPALASSVGTKGDYYVVSTTGSTNLNGITTWTQGDWAIFNGSVWEKVDNTDLVTSVAGRTGAITLTTADIGGLGTIATQNANNVSITGGSITGITDLAIADGGTGSSTAASAITALTGTQTSGRYLRSDGTNAALAAIVAADVPTLNQNTTGNAATVTTNANLTGDVTSVGNATTLTNAPVIAKVLTGYVSGAGTVAATDSILQAIQKLNGNDATNANLTGAVTSVGNATSLGSFTSLQLATALTDETGSGANVFATSPTLVTPLLGTPTSVTLTNATGLPLTTGVTGTLPTANGGTNLTSFTSGGVVYASSSSALATGSALTFDGTNFATTGSGTFSGLLNRIHAQGTDAYITNTTTGKANTVMGFNDSGSTNGQGIPTGYSYYGNLQTYPIGFTSSGYLTNSISSTNHIWNITGTEGMRLNSTGLGIGTSSPAYKLDVVGATGTTTSGIYETSASGSSIAISRLRTSGTGLGYWDIRTGNTASGLTGALDFFDNIASASRVTFSNAGNVGIGTSSPAYRLDVVGGNVSFTNSGTGNTLYLNKSTTPTGDERLFFIGFGANTDLAKARIQGSAESAWTAGTSTPTYLQFSTTPSGSATPTERMRLDSSGNLGIGTSSPADKLEVYSTITARAASGTSALRLRNTTSDYQWQTVAGTNAVSLFDNAVGSARLTLDSSGNLGLGVTPSAWTSNRKVVAVGGTVAAINYAALYGQNAYNCYTDGTNYLYQTTTYAGQFNFNLDTAGAFSWRLAASGTAGNAITFTQAMTLDASGNLGIGTTNPSQKLVVSNAGAEGLEIGPTAIASGSALISYNRSGAAYTQLTASALRHVWQNSGTEVARIDSSGNLGIGTTSPDTKLTVVTGANATQIRFSDATNCNGYLGSRTGNLTTLHTDQTLAFGTGNATFTERARIDSSGNLLVGTTSVANVSKVTFGFTGSTTNGFSINDTEGTATSVGYANFSRSGTSKGSITYNDTTGVVSYNTTSDYRAKDVYGLVTSSGELIDSVPVYMGKMKGATQERPMFIAHETPDYAHTGEKDAVDKDGNPVYQQMDASSLIPVMWAEIQSLRKRLADAGI